MTDTQKKESQSSPLDMHLADQDVIIKMEGKVIGTGRFIGLHTERRFVSLEAIIYVNNNRGVLVTLGEFNRDAACSIIFRGEYTVTAEVKR